MHRADGEGPKEGENLRMRGDGETRSKWSSQ